MRFLSACRQVGMPTQVIAHVGGGEGRRRYSMAGTVLRVNVGRVEGSPPPRKGVIEEVNRIERVAIRFTP